MKIRALILATAALLAGTGAPAAGASSEQGSALVQRVALSASEAAPMRLLSGTADGYTGRPLGRNDLQALADALSQACQGGGLLLCRADIPVQDLSDGILEVRMSEGYVAAIEADESLLPIVERVFAPLLAERPAKEGTFRRAIALLDDIPGLKIKAVRPRRTGGDAYVLEVAGTYERSGLRGLATNRGSRRDKPWKAFLGGEVGSVLQPGDRTSLALLTRPEAPGELVFMRMRYDAAPFSTGLKPYFALAASNASPRSELDGRDVEGELRRAEIGITKPLLRREGLRVDLEVGLEASRSVEKEEEDTLYADELQILTAEILGRRKVGRSGLAVGRAKLKRGLGLGNAGGSSRPDGEAVFTTVSFAADLSARLPRGVVGRLGASGQLSDSPLLFAEEFALGGGRFGRGYDFGEVLGDHGAAGFVELARPIPMKGELSTIEPYVFADTGVTSNKGAGLSADGKALWSSGGGVRLLGRSGWSLHYEAAMPLSDAPYTLEDDSLRHRVDIGFRR
ncbi:ShlB/FhaC/HecB family hemolysin secretion/activation protein [Parvularcula oceani]|uniref:ShlB/FhaC/HecB family hemolysin secretion/activation protein n=1 Tax=Parvularcula oceani TaxID=1247963 RepID=UPI0009DDEC3E|nr:ShlB/FhaC/HecB family hemolysin secretion/activation protein [Parvularcula oceani]